MKIFSLPVNPMSIDYDLRKKYRIEKIYNNTKKQIKNHKEY